MKNLTNKLANLQSGASMVEYAILVALISIAAIIIIFVLGQQINEVFTTVVNCIQDPSTATCTITNAEIPE